VCGHVATFVRDRSGDVCVTAALDAAFISNAQQHPEITYQTYVSQTSGAVRIYPGISMAVRTHRCACVV
jgi:hypothetical protein